MWSINDHLCLCETFSRSLQACGTTSGSNTAPQTPTRPHVGFVIIDRGWKSWKCDACSWQAAASVGRSHTGSSENLEAALQYSDYQAETFDAKLKHKLPEGDGFNLFSFFFILARSFFFTRAICFWLEKKILPDPKIPLIESEKNKNIIRSAGFALQGRGRSTFVLAQILTTALSFFVPPGVLVTQRWKNDFFPKVHGATRRLACIKQHLGGESCSELWQRRGTQARWHTAWLGAGAKEVSAPFEPSRDCLGVETGGGDGLRWD